MNNFHRITLLTVAFLSFSAVYTTIISQSQSDENREFTLYLVQKSEGLYRISVKTGVSQEEIIANNPEIVNGLREGQTLRIPKPASIVKIEKEEFIMHTVQKKETMYSISRQYGVDMQTIEKYNPEVKDGLKTGAILRIPKITIVETPQMQQFSVATSNPTLSTKKPVRIALLLPLMLDVDKDASADRFVEFYEGCLLAINELKSEGISIELYTFDTGKGEDKISAILSEILSKNVDIIMGPAYSNQVKLVENFALKNKINTVIPFSPRVESIEKNPYIFQNNAPKNVRFEQMSKSIAAQFKSENIIIAQFTNDLHNESNEFAKYLITYLKKESIKYNSVFVQDEELFGIKSAFSNNKKNILILGIEKTDVLQHKIAPVINAEKAKISVIGFPSWQHAINSFNDVYLLSHFYINEQSDAVKKYNSEFKHYFGHAITTSFPQFDMLGYDLTYYFGKALSENTLGEKMPQINDKLLQSEFQFEKKNAGGYINERFLLSTPK